MKIDPNKKYQTRDGVPVTHLHRAPEGWPTNHPLIGIVDGNVTTWDDDGRAHGLHAETPDDLIEVREPLEVRLAIDGKEKIWGFAEQNTAKFYDGNVPHRAPFRIATFREVMP